MIAPRFSMAMLALALGVSLTHAQDAADHQVPKSDLEASANGLTSITLQDPLAQPYLPDISPLPPRRPSEAQMAAERERVRLRVQQPRVEARAVPMIGAPSYYAPRSQTLCTSGRCPHSNMIGIQY